MTGQLDIIDTNENLFDKDRLTEILDNRNPYFHQLVRALASKGAFGDKTDGKGGGGRCDRNAHYLTFPKWWFRRRNIKGIE